MVSVTVSKLRCCTGLIFVESGVKVNSAYYRDVLLQKMLPVICSIAGELFICQQVSAPAHRARETVSLLERETPRFIGPDLWPPNSPDLNPVDYRSVCYAGMCLQVTDQGCEQVEAETDRSMISNAAVCH